MMYNYKAPASIYFRIIFIRVVIGKKNSWHRFFLWWQPSFSSLRIFFFFWIPQQHIIMISTTTFTFIFTFCILIRTKHSHVKIQTIEPLQSSTYCFYSFIYSSIQFTLFFKSLALFCVVFPLHLFHMSHTHTQRCRCSGFGSDRAVKVRNYSFFLSTSVSTFLTST